MVTCRSSEDRGRGQFSGFVRQHFLVLENQQSPVAKTSGSRPLGDPQLRVTAPQERMAKLEAALAALHGVDGPEVESLRGGEGQRVRRIFVDI